MTYCWDCELPSAGTNRCISCQAHRDRCDAPQRYEEFVHVTDAAGRSGQLYREQGTAHEWIKVGRAYCRHGKRGKPQNPQPVVMAWYCHGAGPDGNNGALLKKTPHPLTALEVGAR